jgi:hypothetical protein
MLSIGTIIGGAFRLVRERPLSVLVWGLAYSLGALAIGYFMVTWMAPLQPTGQRDDPAAAFAAVGGMFGKLLLLELAFFALYTILLTAAQRAVLRPEESAFASIRFGVDELRMIGLAIFIGILFLIGYLLLALLLGLILAATMATGSVGLGAPGPIAIVLGLTVIAVILFFWVRVSLAFPLTLMRGRFVFSEAWRLSRGHFWTLFGGYLVVMLIVLVLAIGGSLIFQGGYWSQLMKGGLTGPEAQRAAQAQMAAQYSLGLPMLISVAFGSLVGGLTIAFTGGSIATAARALAGDHREVAETFA